MTAAAAPLARWRRGAGRIAALAAALALAGTPRPCDALCLNNCNGHGSCTGSLLDVCVCDDDWRGGAPDCSLRACPSGPAWFDVPTPAGTAHAAAECSGRGTCARGSGVCACAVGYEGPACERMTCPGPLPSTSVAGDCSGHGLCLTMREAAALRDYSVSFTSYEYALWDADMVRGCACDVGWGGHGCSLRLCPLGDDPYSGGTYDVQVVRTSATHVTEVQTVVLSGTDVDEVQVLSVSDSGTGPTPLSGSFTLTFNTLAGCNLCTVFASAQTAVIAHDATEADVTAALMGIYPDNIDAVVVSRTATGGGAEGCARARARYAYEFPVWARALRICISRVGRPPPTCVRARTRMHHVTECIRKWLSRMGAPPCGARAHACVCVCVCVCT